MGSSDWGQGAVALLIPYTYEGIRNATAYRQEVHVGLLTQNLTE